MQLKAKNYSICFWIEVEYKEKVQKESIGLHYTIVLLQNGVQSAAKIWRLNTVLCMTLKPVWVSLSSSTNGKHLHVLHSSLNSNTLQKKLFLF